MSKSTADVFRFMKLTFAQLAKLWIAAEGELNNQGLRGTQKDARCCWTSGAYYSGAGCLPGYMIRSYRVEADPPPDRLALFGVELDVDDKPWDAALVIAGVVHFVREPPKAVMENLWQSHWLRRAAVPSPPAREVSVDAATGLVTTRFPEPEKADADLERLVSFAIPLEAVANTEVIARAVKALMELNEDKPDAAAKSISGLVRVPDPALIK